MCNMCIKIKSHSLFASLASSYSVCSGTPITETTCLLNVHHGLSFQNNIFKYSSILINNKSEIFIFTFYKNVYSMHCLEINSFFFGGQLWFLFLWLVTVLGRYWLFYGNGWMSKFKCCTNLKIFRLLVSRNFFF